MKKICLKVGLSYAARGFSCVKGIPVEVEDDIAADLLKTGRFDIVDAALESADAPGEPSVFASMKKDDLIAFAKEHGIDVEGCKNNGERIQRIQDAMALDEFTRADPEEEVPHEEALD